jgi:parallel beta-helix repeat protein
MSSHRTTLTAAALAVVAPSVAVATSLTASAAEPLGCGSVVTTDVRLTDDLVDCAGSGLVVGASGVTIDLAGHVIDGSGEGTGVDVSAGHDDVRVVGGTVQEFRFGVHLFESDGSTLDRLGVDANLRGVIVERSSHVELSRVVASGNVTGGVDINFSEDVTVRRSTATGNGFAGFGEIASHATTYERNSATGNGFAGLSLWFSDASVLERNHVADNEFHGIELTGVEDARLVRNDARGNAEHGIAIDRGGNTLSRNVAVGNGGIGIAAPEGTIDGGRNTGLDNAGGDCTGISCT